MFRSNGEINSHFEAAVITVCIALFLVVWVIASHFEARSFERVTGKSVSTWDAMFIELRVQEPAAGVKE